MLRYIADVVTLRLDKQKCTGCGMCKVVCPHAVFVINNGKARIENRDRCIECGACARNCPVRAVSVNAGVGCATGILFAALGSTDSCCCAEKRSQPGCCSDT